jgi:hypothetical protein
MSLAASFLWLGAAGSAVIAFRLLFKNRRSSRHPSINDDEFLKTLREKRPGVQRPVLKQRRRVARALSVPYLKLDPAATRQELVETFGVLGDVSFGWDDLKEELADELGKDSRDLEVKTVADLVLGFYLAQSNAHLNILD